MKGYHYYQESIEACLRCAALCDHCATSCTQEEDVNMMADCIRLDMQCATACYAAARLMSLGSEHVSGLIRICTELCKACAEECGKHQNGHCQECAAACKQCAETLGRNI